MFNEEVSAATITTQDGVVRQVANAIGMAKDSTLWVFIEGGSADSTKSLGRQPVNLQVGSAWELVLMPRLYITKLAHPTRTISNMLQILNIELRLCHY